MELIKKTNYRMFGKNIYLIGINTQGEKVFLEHPSWDCGWYWGFGYLETYTNNRQITRSKDISGHSHFSNFDENNILNDWHTLDSCVLSVDNLLKLKQMMREALQLGNEARETKSKEYKNLTQLHSAIIAMLTV
jgi:hypothetical protein